MARFIVSHRLSGTTNRKESRERFDKLESTLRADSAIKFDNKPLSDEARRILHIEGDPQELEAQRANWDSDVLIEPERLRYKAITSLSETAMYSLQAQNPGLGTAFKATIQGAGQAATNTQTTLFLAGLYPGTAGTSIRAATNSQGEVSFAYDPTVFAPSLLFIEPHDSYWEGWQTSPVSGGLFNLPLLPKDGPISWWHRVVGMFASSPERGAGIKVGIADTGVGPHPYLDHVRNLGSILNGAYDSSPSSGTDIEEHGTHVSGLIGARPAIGSGGYAGIAEGAEVMSLRIFAESSGANQGDIAQAIETLSLNESADLINLSLGGPVPSNIERDAIRAAFENGTLCIISAGNGYGQPVMYPAAYPEAIAVSAVGLLGIDPPGTAAANCVPSQADQFAGWLYLGNFSNIGPQIACTAPGVGIVSTVPATKEIEAPYADMSGTSLAAPVVCASLATLLSQYPAYSAMRRDTSRAQCAAAVLAASLRPLGLNPIYAGGGLCQSWPSY